MDPALWEHIAFFEREEEPDVPVTGQTSQPGPKRVFNSFGWVSASQVCGVQDFFQKRLFRCLLRISIRKCLSVGFFLMRSYVYWPMAIRIRILSSISTPNKVSFFLFLLCPAMFDKFWISVVNHRPFYINLAASRLHPAPVLRARALLPWLDLRALQRITKMSHRETPKPLQRAHRNQPRRRVCLTVHVYCVHVADSCLDLVFS